MHQTAQVKGSTKIIVTVVATQELEPGDVLRRFKAAQDGPHGYSRSSSALCMRFSSLVLWCFFVAVEGVRVYALVCSVFLSTLISCISEQRGLKVVASPSWKRYNIEKA